MDKNSKNATKSGKKTLKNGSKKFHPKIEFVQNILSNFGKTYLTKPQKSNFLSFTMKTYLPAPSRIVQCCSLARDFSSTLYNGRGNEGEIQLHSKIESVQNILCKISDRLLVLWPNNHKQHCISTDIFFLPDNNYLDLTLNKTNIVLQLIFQ